MSGEPVQVNLRNLVLALGAVLVAIFFGINALANNDPLWFLPVFNETPLRIVVYKFGCETDLFEGQPGFDELTQAVNQSVSNLEGIYETYGLSDESLKHYRANELALEVIYPQPVTIHTNYRFGRPDSLFIGLSSNLGDDRTLFGGHAGTFSSGALRLKSNAALRQAAEKIPCPAQ